MWLARECSAGTDMWSGSVAERPERNEQAKKQRVSNAYLLQIH